MRRFPFIGVPFTSFTLLALLILVLAGPLPSLRAAITWDGNVEPSDPAPTAWTSSIDGYVGKTAYGNLTVDSSDSASHLHSRYGYIGYRGDSMGVVTVDGPGSAWNNDGYLNVGYCESGTLNITNGGKVRSAGA